MAYGAAGFARGFSSAIKNLSDFQRLKMEMDEAKERKEREKQFRDITKEELGRVGQQPQTSTAGIREATGISPTENLQTAIPPADGGPTLRQAAGFQEGLSSVGAQATALPSGAAPVTREDAMLRILERGMAVDPDKAFDMVLKGLQVEDILGTSKQKRAFREWQSNFNTEVGKLKQLEELAETDPKAFITGVKKIGVDIRPVSLGGGKQAYEAYYGGNKVGQYDSLTSAASDGLELYTQNQLIQGSAKFATSVDQFVTILSTANRLTVDNQRLGLQKRELALKEEAAPGQRELTAAQASKARAEAGKAAKGSPDETLRNNIALAEQYRKQLADVDTQLQNYSPGSPEHTALVRQRNQINTALNTVNKALSPANSSSAKIDIEGARAAAASGINPDTGKPFTDAEKKEYERIFKEPFPAPKSAIPVSTSAETSTPTSAPTKRDYGTLGRLTPQGILERAAQQGNQSAIAELRRRQAVKEAEGSRPPEQSPFGF